MNHRAEKLLTKFHDASALRMAKLNEKEAPTQPLFHYTNEQALFGIIGSNKFWFTSIYHMDDDAELSFGFGVSHGLLSAAMEREDVHTKTFLKPLVEDYKFEKIKARFEFYSASFGQKDDPKQWADYAGGGSGIALGLMPGFFGLAKTEGELTSQYSLLVSRKPDAIRERTIEVKREFRKRGWASRSGV
jgi:hypothetical protein